MHVNNGDTLARLRCATPIANRNRNRDPIPYMICRSPACMPLHAHVSALRHMAGLRNAGYIRPGTTRAPRDGKEQGQPRQDDGRQALATCSLSECAIGPGKPAFKHSRPHQHPAHAHSSSRCACASHWQGLHMHLCVCLWKSPEARRVSQLHTCIIPHPLFHFFLNIFYFSLQYLHRHTTQRT